MTKILVIDDDDSLRRTLGATLEQQGFQVLQATSGAKGVELARELQPDVILCDVYMEGADGRLTLYALRRDPQVASIPFVLMSAIALSGEALPGTGRGADGFLRKPFTQEKLLATIGSCLDKVKSPNAEIQPATVVNDETRKASSHEALLQLLGQIIDATHRISMTDPHDAPDEVMRLARQAHQSALRLKSMIEDQTR